MKNKTTDDLITELTVNHNISDYMNTNQAEFLNTPLHLYLQQLLISSNLKVSQVAQKSFKGEYIYQVFRGIKKPSRDVLISIALAIELGFENTQALLRTAQAPLLDARNRRDSILIFSTNRHLSVPDTNDILFEYNETTL